MEDRITLVYAQIMIAPIARGFPARYNNPGTQDACRGNFG